MILTVPVRTAALREYASGDPLWSNPSVLTQPPAAPESASDFTHFHPKSDPRLAFG